MKATAICDGRGNADTAARAAVLYIGEGSQRERQARAEKIPATTNIVAEHLAIQLAMELAKEHGVTELVIYNDSRSPVNHVNGNYKVKQEHLIPIVEETWEMRAEFSSFEICWTRRENTKAATQSEGGGGSPSMGRVGSTPSGLSRPHGACRPSPGGPGPRLECGPDRSPEARAPR